MRLTVLESISNRELANEVICPRFFQRGYYCNGALISENRAWKLADGNFGGLGLRPLVAKGHAVPARKDERGSREVDSPPRRSRTPLTLFRKANHPPLVDPTILV
jgi:hypothetical protein